MPKYVPTPQEQAMVDQLIAMGYAVVRQRTYDRLQERVRVAEVLMEAEKDRREGTAHWAHQALDEQRRLSDRLNDVCTAAAACGVPIRTIQAALDKTDEPAKIERRKMQTLVQKLRTAVMKHETREAHIGSYVVRSDLAQKEFVSVLEELK